MELGAADSAAATGATASAAITVHGCIAASGGSAQATSAAAIAVAQPGDARARDFRIEDRDQTAFELRAVGHGERGAGQQGRIASAAHDARDFEQLLCVVWAARPARQDEVVARPLTFGPDMARGHPGERVEPVKGAGQLRDDVRQAVAALDVRELVQQDDPQPFERPSIRILGHDHRRRKDPDAIGIVARALSRKARRRVMSSSAASSTASGSHGASTTRTVRRDSHWTATSPTTNRPSTAHTPAAQMSTSAIVSEMRGMTPLRVAAWRMSAIESSRRGPPE